MKTISQILSIGLFCLHFSLVMATAKDTLPQDMNLLGQGEVRYLKLIKVYSAKLYATKKDMDQNPSRCLVLEYAVSLQPQDMITAANTVLEKQYSAATLARFQSQITDLHSSYQKVSEGDHYSLCYDSVRQVTTLSLNNQLLTTIPSAEFAQLYFGIWLSANKPIDAALQRQLLASRE